VSRRVFDDTHIAILWKLIEVGKDRVSHELRPESQDLHPVRIKFFDDFSLWTQ
jgi:hypothetical protein